MPKGKFTLYKDTEFMELVSKTDPRVLGAWAKSCTMRVLPYFEKECPGDVRPQKALKALQEWIDTGLFSMKIIRKASLDSHAAAREVGQDNAARSAARAAGQAVATAHVKTHAYGAAIYAQQAIHRATDSKNAEAAVAKEKDWQLKLLINLSQWANRQKKNKTT
jgi:hypothetical protein